MHHVHDAHSRLATLVENQVIANREAAVTGSQFVALPADVGALAQQLKVLDQQIDESISGGLAIIRDVGPDPQDVPAGPGG
jgi:hypothetical protein